MKINWEKFLLVFKKIKNGKNLNNKMIRGKDMGYPLEHENEAYRLEKQITMNNYLLEKELRQLSIPKNSLVMDAGCGSGLLSRYISKHFPQISIHAYDLSELRLKQAESLTPTSDFKNISYYQTDLGKMESIQDETYDFLINRFVLEHLIDPQGAVSQFYRVLKPKGKVCIIDLDGVFLNIYTANPKFNRLHQKIIHEWPTDLFVGRKIPTLLKNAHFHNISFENQVMNFKGKDLEDELELTKERITFASPYFEKIFNSRQDLEYYKRAYLEEFVKESTVIFYNKFIVYAEKS